MKSLVYFFGILLLSLFQELQGVRVQVAEQVTYRKNRELRLPNNQFVNFSGAALEVEPWIDENTGVRMTVSHLKQLTFSKYNGQGLKDLSDIVPIGENAVMAYNENEFIVGEISKVNDQLVMFKEISRKTYESKEVMPFTSLYTSSGPLKSTFMKLSSNLKKDKIQLYITQINGEEKTVEYPVSQAVTGDMEINLQLDSMVEVLIVAKDQGDNSCVFFTSFDFLTATGQEEIITLGCSDNFNYVKIVEWKTPGKSFYLFKNSPEEGLEVLLVYIKWQEGSKPDLDVESLIKVPSTQITAQDCGGLVFISDYSNNQVFITLPDQRGTYKFELKKYGISQIKDTFCTNGHIIKILGKTEDEKSRLLIYRTPLYSTPGSILHSLIDLPDDFTYIGAISQGYNDKTLDKDCMLIYGIKGTELKQNTIKYYEIHSYGPHLKLDFTEAKEGIEKFDIVYNISDWDTGSKVLTSINSTLNLIQKDFRVNATVHEQVELSDKEIPLFDLLNVSNYPYSIQLKDATAIKLVEGFPINKSFLDLKYYFTESVMADRYIFGKTGSGLQVIDKDTKENLLKDTPECTSSKLKTVYGAPFEEGPYFYCLCSDLTNNYATQDVLFIFKSKAGGFISFKMNLRRTGFQKVVILSPPNKIDRTFVITLINTKGTSTTSLGTITIDKETEKCTTTLQRFDSMAFNIGTLVTSFLVRDSIVMLNCEKFATWCEVVEFMFDPESHKIKKLGIGSMIQLPNPYEYHEGSRLRCVSFKGTDKVRCLVLGSNLFSFVLDFNMIEVRDSQMIFVPASKKFENIENLYVEDVIMVNGLGVISGSVRLSEEANFGAFNYSFWLQIIDLENPQRLLKIITTNSSTFTPRVLPMADGSFKIYPGAELDGSLTVLETINTSLKLLKNFSDPQTIEGFLEFSDLNGEVSGSIKINQLFSAKKEERKESFGTKNRLLLVILLTIAVVTVSIVAFVGKLVAKRNRTEDDYHKDPDNCESTPPLEENGLPE